MYLSIATTHRPATDLGFLLMKNPDRVHEKVLPYGRATLFYPEASEARCAATLLVDIDPVGLVRGRRGQRRFGPDVPYVTDRLYAASSILSVAISRLLGTAMAGRSRERQALADTPIPLVAEIAPLPCRGGPEILERVFAPLGYRVETDPKPLDGEETDSGAGHYVTARIAGRARLADLLTHLFVLIPVMDNQKHYWVGPDEVEKLLAKGEGWLETHPEKELIARRYLRHRRGLARHALDVLAERVAPLEEEEIEAQDEVEEVLEKPIRLNDARMEAVAAALAEAGAESVVDLGCGEGRLLRRLMKDRRFTRLLGVDVSATAVARAAARLHLDRLTPRQRGRIDLIQGSFTYRDARIEGFDAAAAVEVIEHIEPARIPAFEQALFGAARPGAVVVSTPNREYNATFEDFAPGRLRHPDHRFEWTRAEFEAWASGVAARFGYGVAVQGIGEAHADYGPPTQMAVFRR